MGRVIESGRVRWKISNSRGKCFPHIESYYRTHQSAISCCVWRKTFYCTITKNWSIPDSWTFICKNIRELAMHEYLNLAYLWSKSERESGVKLDIQRDSNSKIFQQPKNNTLTNCDIEHVTKNLYTTVSQKSKSYLDAEKVNLADNDNNKTFPSRSTIDQRFAENEGAPTSESPTAKMEV